MPTLMLRYLDGIRRHATRMFLTVAGIMVPVMVLVYAAERPGLTPLTTSRQTAAPRSRTTRPSAAAA